MTEEQPPREPFRWRYDGALIGAIVLLAAHVAFGGEHLLAAAIGLVIVAVASRR